MFRFFDKANYDFLAVRRWAYAATGAVAAPIGAVLSTRTWIVAGAASALPAATDYRQKKLLG